MTFVGLLKISGVVPCRVLLSTVATGGPDSKILLACFVLKHAINFVKLDVKTGAAIQFYFNQMN